jgi:simple sugar transport system substrate-binding protein
MRNGLRFLLFACVMALALPSVSMADQKHQQSGKDINIVFDAGGAVGEPYATVVQHGAEQAAADLGCSVKFVYSDWDPQLMVENFKKSLASKPDGIVVMGHPGDDAYAPLIDEAVKKGVIVTATDTELPKLTENYQSKGFGYAGVDNKARGIALASEALRRFNFKKGDKVLVWGLKSKPTRGQSTIGIIETLEKAGLVVGYMEITPEIDKDASLGAPLLTAYLAANPDTKAVFMDHGALTGQLENFFRAAGLPPGKVIGCGFSLSPATAAAIKSGYVSLVGDGQPFLQGYLPVLQIVLTKKYGFSGLVVETGAGFVHKDNIDFIAPLAQKGLR